jgi:hypothetical protein
MAQLYALFLLTLLVLSPPVSAQITGSTPQQPGPVWNRYLTPRSMDGDGIAELIERVARNGGVAHLPGGIYRINKTISLDGVGPIRIEGESFGLHVNPKGGGFRAQATRLVWTGPAGGTMILLNGAVGQSFSNLHLDGGGKARTLVQLSARPGWGTGNQRWTRVLFSDADTAIQCGTEEGEFNNADVLYDEVVFLNCKTGLRTMNHQSVNHHFRSFNAHQIETTFDFVRGGNLYVDGWAAGTFDLLLRVGYGGPNAGTFRFVAGRPEMNGSTKRYARLVDAEPKDSAQIVLEGTQETGGPYDDKLPDNSSQAVFRVGPRATVVVRDHYHMRPALDMAGGVYRDRDSRWQNPIMEMIFADKAAAARPAGRVDVTGAMDINGAPQADVKRGS